MHLTRSIKIQLALFLAVAMVAITVIALNYAHAPALLFGAGRYKVTVQLPVAAGLYPTANVTYLGTEVGRVDSVQLTDSGVSAVLSLKSSVDIPSDVDAQVHSQSAVGEQYVALLPRKDSAPLKGGDVIPLDRTSVPPDINNLLDDTNRGLQAIPQDNLRTTIDEGYLAIGGLGPEISRIVKGSTQLAIDAGKNLDSITTLIDKAKPVLDSQTHTAGSINAWAEHMANITGQLRDHDTALAGLLANGPAATDQARQLVDRLQPTLPVLMANLASTGKVVLAYQPAVEQILVLLPRGVEMLQGAGVTNWNNPSPYAGLTQDFKLNVNVTHPCTTGFLPAQQMRPTSVTDRPERPGGLYCRIPQDASVAVRGARNLPCLTVPGKRAPTAKMCESNEQYVPLNDGNSWKGDPNATLSGQDIPQLPPGVSRPPEAIPAAPPAAPAPPIATATYDPATGSYVAPDGRLYSRDDLTHAKEPQTWQTMLTPN